ncbi:MAG: M15 family metallopeptidase [Bacteroidetes bacterium]|nr:M15 family metallopeptidase [Bacteroidota bacterium]
MRNKNKIECFVNKASSFDEALLLVFFLFFLYSCKSPVYKEREAVAVERTIDSVSVVPQTNFKIDTLARLEKYFIDLGLVNVSTLDSTIQKQLRYSSFSNVLEKDLYGGLSEVYLETETAAKLVLANTFLQQENPQLRLLIWDAARPVYIQKLLWDSLHTKMGHNQQYLSHPSKHSLHNYGAAVDLTLVDTAGNLLDMGTDFDYFGALAEPTKEAELLAAKLLTLEQITNRKILRTAMQKGGFSAIPSEWWHFNACSKTYAASKYKLIN